MATRVCTRDDCPDKGTAHRYCAAHKRASRGGGPCTQYPLTGQEVCRMHGGKSPQALAGATARREEATARRELFALGKLPTIDPGAALLDLIAWKHGEVLALRARLAGMDEGALVWGVTSEAEKTSGQFPGIDTTRSAEANVWWRLLRQAEDQLAAFAAAAHRAGIAEREVRLAEQQGELVVGVIRGILDALLEALRAAGLPAGLQAAWPVLVGQIVPEKIRAIQDQPVAS